VLFYIYDMKNILYYIVFLLLLIGFLINDAQNQPKDFKSGVDSVENPYEKLTNNN